ncbi:MAG: histidine kinase dimerization/phospho-acceptor domain-containing protein, partial [Bacteroidota bacterium]
MRAELLPQIDVDALKSPDDPGHPPRILLLYGSLREQSYSRFAAEEAARVRSQFLASMSHEIRTPLTSVVGFTELLRDEVEEAQRGLVDAIAAGGERLLSTLDSVLDLATLDARRETLRPTTLDVVEAIGTALEAVRPRAEEKGLDLAIEPFFTA